MSSNNTVDTSPERIAAEWAVVRSEASEVQSASTTPELQAQGAAPADRPEVGMGADGFDVPDIPTGDLCCFAGAIAVDRLAPNWRAHGLTNEQIESVGRPLGLVIDKHLERYFPGQSLGDLVGPYKEELALGFAVFSLYTALKGVPRRLPAKKPDTQPEQPAQEAA